MQPNTDKIKKKAKKLVDNQGSTTLAILDDTEKILENQSEIKDSLKTMCDTMPKTYDDTPIIESLTQIKTLIPSEYDDSRITQAIFSLTEEIKKKDFRGLTGERGLQGLPGKDGINGRDGVDGYTPIWGVDYFNGKDGKDYDPTVLKTLEKKINDVETIAKNNSLPITTMFVNGTRAKNIIFSGATISYTGDTANVSISSGGVTSVTALNNSVTITPTTGAVTVSVPGALVHPTTGSTFEYSQVPVGLTGLHNTGLGVDAGKALTSGLYNVAISQDALKSATDATSVIAIGFEAAKSVVTGAANSIVMGTSNASLATTLTTSTLIGTRLATSASGVVSIIGVGDLMFQSIDASAINNLGIGFNLFNAISQDASNYGIGKNIGDAATSISATFLFGEDLLRNATGVSGVFAFGQNQFNNLAFASNLYGIGSSNMNGSGAGAFDAFLIGSGIANTGAAFMDGVVAIGTSIASVATDPSLVSSVVIGKLAGEQIVSIDSEVYIGANAGGQSQTGQQNVFIGLKAGYGIVAGISNVYSGYFSGAVYDTTESVGLGTLAASSWNGSKTTFAGAYSGQTGAGDEIVGYGYKSFDTTNTLTRSMALGAYAGAVYSTDVTDVVLVGYATEASSTTATNEIDFGSASSGLYNVNFGWGGKASTAPAGGIVTLAPTATAGSNLTGSRIAIQAGNGTGTGGSGAIEFYTAPVGTTGTTPNTMALIASISNTGLATFNGVVYATSTIELGHASDTTLSRSSAGVLAVEGVVIPSISSTNTLTNKRITKRVLSLSAGSATPTINTDNYDVVHITAQSAAVTSFTTNLTGTPVEGDTLEINITDDGTARAITWGTSFESSGNITLPTTTVISTRMDIAFVWNTVTSKWRIVGIA